MDGRGTRKSQPDNAATPLFTCFAKVYTMNPSTRIWNPETDAAVPVSFYYDDGRSVYRIISYDGPKLVINSTMIPTMTFLKPSNTFGVWSDTKLRIIFGLGFSSQSCRDETADWFEKLVRKAASLESSLPLPPPASTALSDYIDASGDKTAANGSWNNNESQNSTSNTTIKEYLAPRSLTESKGEISTVPVSFENILVENENPGSNEVTQLALKNLQYEREASKLRQTEGELMKTRETLGKVQDSLVRKSSETDQMRKELEEVKERLHVELTKAQYADALLKEEKSRVVALEQEVAMLKEGQAKQLTVINQLKAQDDRLRAEIESLMEGFRRAKVTQDNVQTLTRGVKDYCQKIDEKVKDILDLQDTLKQICEQHDY